MFECVNKNNLFNTYKKIEVKLSLKALLRQERQRNVNNEEFWRLESMIDRIHLLDDDDQFYFDRGFNEDGFVEE